MTESPIFRGLNPATTMDLARICWKATKRAYLVKLLDRLQEPGLVIPAQADVYRTSLPADLPGAMLQATSGAIAVVNRDWPEPVVSLPLGAPIDQPLRNGAVISRGDETRTAVIIAECPDLDAEILGLAETACRLGLIHADGVAAIRAGLVLADPDAAAPGPTPGS